MSERLDEYALADRVDLSQWKRAAAYIKPYKREMIILLLAAVGTGFFDALFPLMTRYAIAEFIENKRLAGLASFAVGFVFLALCQTILNVIYSKKAIVIEMGVDRNMRRDLFSHVQELSLDYFNDTPVGFILSRIMSDTEKLGGVFSWMAADVTWNTAYIIFAVWNMFSLNGQLAAVILVSLPPLYLVYTIFRKRLLVANRRVRRQNSRVTGAYNEYINGAVTVKELDFAAGANREFKQINGEMREKSLFALRQETIFTPCIMIISCLGLSAIMGIAPGMVSRGVLDVATMAAFITYTFNLLSPVESISRGMTRIISLQANVERVNRLTDAVPLVKDRADVIEKYGTVYEPKEENWEKIKGDIEFCDVSFKYPGSEKYVLEHFNLKVAAGTCVAIVGATGAGKSTLVNLVCRFYEPTRGKILIDGRDIRDRSVLWLERNLSYVLQTPHLFSGTIADNIRYANPAASTEQVIRAAKAAQAHSFIEKLPEGYNTQVGQGGDKLSTGQKQLVSIARAILADGKILVMDEATSSVDTQTELLINGMTGRLMKNRTSFIIAHRLSTVKNADVIIVVEEGKIVEMGTHRQLLRRGGAYYQMYTGQWEEERQSEFFQNLHREDIENSPEG